MVKFPELVSHWLSYSKICFTTIIFCDVGQTQPAVQWRKRKPNYQEHEKSRVFFIYLTFRIAFLFLFLKKCRIHFLCACYYCVICSCEWCEMFKYSFLYRAHPVHYTFQKSCVMIEFLGCLRVVLDVLGYFSYFLCHCFVFHNSRVRIRSSLFRIYLVFIPKFSLSVTLAQITRTAPLLFRLNH